MKFRELPWDSAFFQAKIGAATLEVIDAPEELSKFFDNKCHAFDCIYIFVPHPAPEGFSDMLRRMGAVLYDRKTVFAKKLTSVDADDDEHIKKITSPGEECFELAAASGWKSRFFLDEYFRPYQKALYRRWVENCLASNAVCGVWEYRSQAGDLAGMMCAECDDKTGHIGLIAVKKEYRGQGIGSALMRSAERFYARNGMTEAEVVTQLDNDGACRLYEKCDYEITKIMEIWHLWKR